MAVWLRTQRATSRAATHQESEKGIKYQYQESIARRSFSRHVNGRPFHSPLLFLSSTETFISTSPTLHGFEKQWYMYMCFGQCPHRDLCNELSTVLPDSLGSELGAIGSQRAATGARWEATKDEGKELRGYSGAGEKVRKKNHGY
eukprot:scaffold18987_cov109-Isochrysis_galbana.AAC.8